MSVRRKFYGLTVGEEERRKASEWESVQRGGEMKFSLKKGRMWRQRNIYLSNKSERELRLKEIFRKILNFSTFISFLSFFDCPELSIYHANLQKITFEQNSHGFE